MSCLGEPDWLDLVSDDPLNDGLVSLYLAGEHTWGNPRWFDAVHLRNGAGGNHGTLTNGPTWQGPLGLSGSHGSLNFVAASSQYVDIGNPSSLVISTGNATLSAWVKLGVTAGDGTGIISYGNAAVTRLLCIEQTTGGFARIELYDGTNNPTATGTSMLSDIGWCHIAGVRDSGTLRIYVNGAQEGTGTDTAVDVSGGASQIWTIGRRMDARYLGGNVAKARVHNRALSASEIMALYQDDLAGNPLTLNWTRPRVALDQGGGAAAAFPWHYYQQMMAG